MQGAKEGRKAIGRTDGEVTGLGQRDEEKESKKGEEMRVKWSNRMRGRGIGKRRRRKSDIPRVVQFTGPITTAPTTTTSPPLTLGSQTQQAPQGQSPHQSQFSPHFILSLTLVRARFSDFPGHSVIFQDPSKTFIFFLNEPESISVPCSHNP